MSGVSGLASFDLSGGDERVVAETPVVLTSVVACEQTGIDMAAILLGGTDGQAPYYRVRLRPGETVSFADRVALPWGLTVLCQAGEIGITVAWQ